MRIETERLIIDEFTLDMSYDVWQNSQDEDTKRFVPDEVFWSEEEAAEVIAFLAMRYGTDASPQVYPVLTRDGGVNVGYVQLVRINLGERWEIGYHIAKRYTGRGYATEAVRAFLPVITETLGLSRVYGICLRENFASRRVLEKCDFVPVFEGIGDYQGKKREIFKGVWMA